MLLSYHSLHLHVVSSPSPSPSYSPNLVWLQRYSRPPIQDLSRVQKDLACSGTNLPYYLDFISSVSLADGHYVFIHFIHRVSPQHLVTVVFSCRVSRPLRSVSSCYRRPFILCECLVHIVCTRSRRTLLFRASVRAHNHPPRPRPEAAIHTNNYRHCFWHVCILGYSCASLEPSNLSYYCACLPWVSSTLSGLGPFKLQHCYI